MSSTASSKPAAAEKIAASEVKVGDIIASSRKAVLDGAGNEVVTIEEHPETRRFLDGGGATISRPKKTTEVWRAAEKPAEGESDTPAPARTRGGNAPKPASPAFEWPKPPAEVLLAYLKTEVTDAADAPNQGKPYINESGKLFMTGSHFREWLTEHGMAPSKGESSRPMREAGLVMRAVSLPGEDRAMGFYQGKAPRGTGDLPRRKVARATAAPRNPFARIAPEHAAYLRTLLEAAPQTDERDELLALLPAQEA